MFVFEREGKRTRAREGQRERGRQRIPRRLYAVHAQPNIGPKLTNHEIMT